ncbi:MAG: hypothetical protein IT303_04055 [Dehalococcoidia bacterium]|nr:hypothetical protein [Dehalococcoidia bacterium]
MVRTQPMLDELVQDRGDEGQARALLRSLPKPVLYDGTIAFSFVHAPLTLAVHGVSGGLPHSRG